MTSRPKKTSLISRPPLLANSPQLPLRSAQSPEKLPTQPLSLTKHGTNKKSFFLHARAPIVPSHAKPRLPAIQLRPNFIAPGNHKLSVRNDSTGSAIRPHGTIW